jgi:FkbM family methyltransferase
VEDEQWPSEAFRCASALVQSANPNKRICVLDVGSHKGETFRHFSNLIPGDLTYFGFEPNPESFAALSGIAESASNTSRSVSFFPTAVGATSESVVFRIAKASEVSGILVPETELLERVPSGDHELKATVEVDQICVDDFIERNQLGSVDILKIDTEGYDLEVVRGAVNSLRRGLVDVVVCEVFFVKYRENQAFFWDIATELASLGFSFVNLFDARNTSQARLYTANAIWVSPRLSLQLGYL